MWHTGTIDGYYYEAKVYDEPSHFGINGGRVSKLAICEGDEWDSQKQIYGYDRGLDLDNSPNGLVDKILAMFQSV